MRASTYSMALVWLLIYALILMVCPQCIHMAWLMIILFVGASRLSWRLFRDLYIKSDSGSLKKVLIVGAGDAGAMLAREIDKNRHLGLKALGFVDDEASKQRNILYGIRVLGTRKDIPRLVRELAIDEVIIAMPSVAGATIREIVDICKQSRVKVKKSCRDCIRAATAVSFPPAEVQMEDLLKREEVKAT